MEIEQPLKREKEAAQGTSSVRKQRHFPCKIKHFRAINELEILLDLLLDAL